jgi:hypothetical protein
VLNGDDTVAGSLEFGVCSALTRRLAGGGTERTAPQKRVVNLRKMKMAITGTNPFGAYDTSLARNSFSGIGALDANAKAAANKAGVSGNPQDGLAATEAQNKRDEAVQAKKSEMDSTHNSLMTALRKG